MQLPSNAKPAARSTPNVRLAAQSLGSGSNLSSTPMTVSRLRPYATTVFAEMSALAARIGAVNLGQGFPDEDGPPAMLEGRPRGHRRRRQPVPAGDRHRCRCGRRSPRSASGISASSTTPTTEVLVTVGATEAIAAAVIGLVEPGSEVIC